MSTAAQIEANRNNSRLSTGPKSPEGKAIVSKNAVKTGLCSKDILLPGESLDEFEALQLSFMEQINPLLEGLERVLFDELTASAWKLRRIQRFETELQSQCDDLLAALDDDKLQKKLDNLARHKTRIERTFHRSLKELKALQTQRALAMVTNGDTTEMPGLADPRAIAKQTQMMSKENFDKEFLSEQKRYFVKLDAQTAALVAISRSKREAQAA